MIYIRSNSCTFYILGFRPEMLVFCLFLLVAAAAAAPPAGCSANGTWWYDEPSTKHGVGYKKVRAFGAKGDGVTDDTAAILSALTTGRQPVYTTATPTAVYFPPGTYIVSASLPLYMYTFLSGSPCAPSIVKLADNANFNGYIFDGDKGQGGEFLAFLFPLSGCLLTLLSSPLPHSPTPPSLPQSGEMMMTCSTRACPT